MPQRQRLKQKRGVGVEEKKQEKVLLKRAERKINQFDKTVILAP